MGLPFTEKKISTRVKEKVYAPPVQDTSKESEVIEPPAYVTGQVINHKDYGEGKIIRVSNNNMLACDFQGSLRTVSVTSLVPLEALDD